MRILSPLTQTGRNMLSAKGNTGSAELKYGDSAMYNQPLSDASLIGCPHCDLLQRLPKLDPGGSARTRSKAGIDR
jgi:hypothetical protein